MKKGRDSLNETAQCAIQNVIERAKPCPFCGSKPKIHYNIDSFHDIEYYIQCGGCGLVFNDSWGTYHADDIEKEVDKWNVRHVL